MKALALVALLWSLGSCAAPIPANQLQWSVDCPPSVEKGAAFEFTVRARDAKGTELRGLEVRYTIRWAPGSGNPLCQAGTTGSVLRAHARTVSGPAEFSITVDDASGAPVQVRLEPVPTFLVK